MTCLSDFLWRGILSAEQSHTTVLGKVFKFSCVLNNPTMKDRITHLLGIMRIINLFRNVTTIFVKYVCVCLCVYIDYLIL